MVTPPILDNKNASSPSIFVPSAMGQDGMDFEKGDDGGIGDALSVLESMIEALYREALRPEDSAG